MTITEAMKHTGKSRRTLHRLAHHLAKTAPDQVLREKTAKGEIWRIHGSLFISHNVLEMMSHEIAVKRF